MNASSIRLAAPAAALRVDPAQGLCLRWPAERTDPAGGAAVPLWQLVLQEPSVPWQAGRKFTVNAGDCVGRVERSDGVSRLIYASLRSTERGFAVRVVIEPRETDGGFELALTVENGESDLTVRQVVFPILPDLNPPPDGALLWPDGLGRRFAQCTAAGFRQTLSYPSGRGSMPWVALAGGDRGLYIGRHDPEMQWAVFDASAQAGGRGLTLSITHSPFCAPGARWTTPPVVIRPYGGSWHTAARLYRRWHETVARPIDIPQWARRSSGWLLAVLKQQNGQVMWDYRTGIDRLCDLAQERGLDTLGLFGWAHGGHDYLYPDYLPDPLMGGDRALRSALRRARERGIRTVLYANGIIMDSSTDFYRYQGNDAVQLNENQEPTVSSIRKFHSATPVTFAQACPGSEVWRRQMTQLALQASDLGADGILYDQVGVYGPALCHSTRHHHDTPATAYTRQRRGLMREIALHLRARNDQFAVMTEGMHDTLIDSVAYVHGWGTGYSALPDSTLFPELFRVTFPQLPMTNRHSTPMLDRRHANYAFVHGLRFEIETRYAADVAYLTEGRVPTADDYADCAYYPPDVQLMSATEPAIATAYLKRLIDLRARHADLLLGGRFIDTEGIELEADGLVAKAYANSDRVAVCLWNPTNAPQPFRLGVAGAEALGCEEPEIGMVPMDRPLPAQSVRVCFFRRTERGES